PPAIVRHRCLIMLRSPCCPCGSRPAASGLRPSAPGWKAPSSQSSACGRRGIEETRHHELDSPGRVRDTRGDDRDDRPARARSRDLTHADPWLRGVGDPRRAAPGDAAAGKPDAVPFRAFHGRPAWQLMDAELGFREAFGLEGGPVESAVFGQPEEAAMVGALEQFLRELQPAPDPAVELVDRIVGRIATDRDVVRVEDLARAMGLGRRTVERLFREYVGPSPKRVIRQYRLQAAADEAAKAGCPNWSRLAHDLGYAD